MDDVQTSTEKMSRMNNPEGAAILQAVASGSKRPDKKREETKKNLIIATATLLLVSIIFIMGQGLTGLFLFSAANQIELPVNLSLNETTSVNLTALGLENLTSFRVSGKALGAYKIELEVNGQRYLVVESSAQEPARRGNLLTGMVTGSDIVEEEEEQIVIEEETEEEILEEEEGEVEERNETEEENDTAPPHNDELVEEPTNRTEEEENETVEETINETITPPMNETEEEELNETVELPVNQTTEEPINETVEETINETVTPPTNETVIPPINTTINDTIGLPVNETILPPTNETEEERNESVQRPVNETVDTPLNETIMPPVNETTEEPLVLEWKDIRNTCAETCELPSLSNATLIITTNDELIIDSFYYTLAEEEVEPRTIIDVPDFTVLVGETITIDAQQHFEGTNVYDISTLPLPTTVEENIITISANQTGTYSAQLYAVGERLRRSNEFTIRVVDEESVPADIRTVQLPARVGEPVLWEITIPQTSEEQVVLSIPAQADNIEITPEYDERTQKGGRIEYEGRVLGTETLSETIREEREEREERESTELVVRGTNETQHVLRYTTPAPVAVEATISESVKRVRLSSEVHYTNVEANALLPIPAPREAITIRWVEENILIEPLEYVDENGDGLIDSVVWVAPHLSNQTFEISITIIDLYSTPMVGGNWTVRFNTTGEANLTITAFNETSYGTEYPDDLTPLTLMCGDTAVNYTLSADDVRVENYTCDNTTSYWTVLVHTTGRHDQQFTFGSMTAYAQNTAYNYSSGILRAYRAIGPLPTTPYGHSEATSTNYEEINVSDNTHWRTTEANKAGDYNSHIFIWNASNLGAIQEINVSWEGYGFGQANAQPTIIEIYDFENEEWHNLDQATFTTTTDQVLGGDISINVSDFINSTSKDIAILAASGYSSLWGGGLGINTDYIQLDMTSSPLIQEVRISPSNPISSQDLTGYCNASDHDGDNVSYSWKWYQDDVEHSSGGDAHETGWCYQETANESTSCGGLATGSYECTGTWSNCANTYDGDWGTFGQVSGTIAYLYINYTKPVGATNESLWQINPDSANSVGNFTILSNCWDQDILEFRVISNADKGDYVNFQCFDGSLWQSISNLNGEREVYEEAMWWDIQGQNYNESLEVNIANISSSETAVDEEWILSCRAYDGIGYTEWTNSTLVTIASDDEDSPIISIHHPADIGLYTNTTTINYTVEDANPDACWYSFDAGTTNSSSVSAGTNFTGINRAKGTHNLTVYCNDTQSNIGSSTATYFLGEYYAVVQDNKLLASDGLVDDDFGKSVSLFEDYVLVGAPEEDSEASNAGAVYVYKRNSSGGYEELQKLTASDATLADRFGYAVSMYDEYAIIGTWNVDKAYVFKKNSTGHFVEHQQFSKASGAFGRVVVVHDDYALIGAQTDAQGGSNAGAVYVYRQNSTGHYEELQKLNASDVAASYQFGNVVAMSGEYALIGANAKTNNRGAAYVFKKNSTGYYEELQILSASDPADSDNFGIAVAISGEYAIVGISGDDDIASNAGAAYVYRKNSTGHYEEAQKIYTSDAQGNDNVGSAVSISGDYLVLGVQGEDTGGGNAGSAYVFKKNSTGEYEELAKFQAEKYLALDKFGNAVDMYSDKLLIGALDKTSGGVSKGAAYVFNLSTEINQPPIIHLPSIEPVTAYTTDTLRGFCKASDEDTSLLGYEYRWYKEGSLHEEGIINYACGDGNIDNGDGTCTAILRPVDDGDITQWAPTPSDGTNYDKVNEETVNTSRKVRLIQAQNEYLYVFTRIASEQSEGEITFDTSWSDRTHTFANQPSGSPWTTQAIDNLVVGIKGLNMLALNYTDHYAISNNIPGESEIHNLTIHLHGVSGVQYIDVAQLYVNITYTAPPGLNFTQNVSVNVVNISSSETNQEEDWVLSCRGYDGNSYSNWQNSTIRTITNRLPSIGGGVSLKSNGDSDRTHEDLDCNVIGTITDNDGDSLNVTVNWYKGGVYNQSVQYLNDYASGSSFLGKLLSGNTTKGDVWRCEIALTDGYDTVYANSTDVTILNTPPITDTPTIDPLTAYTDDDLVGSCSASDADTDNVRYNYRWYKDGSINQSGTSGYFSESTTQIISTLSDKETEKDEVWVFSCQADDGTSTGAWENSTSRTIQNTAPTVTNSYILPSGPDTNDELLGYCNSTDIDDDSITYYFEWYRNSALHSSGSQGPFAQGTAQNVGSVDSSETTKGETWILGCRAWDGEDNSTWQNSTLVSIVNAAPSTPTVNINTTDGTNHSNQDLNCFATITDPDSENMNVTVNWYKDDTFHSTSNHNNNYVSGSSFSTSLDASNTRAWERWVCELVVTDGTDSTSTNSTELSVVPYFFVSTWNTSNAGVSNDNQIQLPLRLSGTYNFTVLWGDGTNDTITSFYDAERTHTYAVEGVYQVNITGTLIGWSFDNIRDEEKLLTIDQWGELRLGNQDSYFRGASNLEITATDVLDLTGTTNMIRMFQGASSLTTVPSMNEWDVSAVTTISNMFAGATNFNQDISDWDTGSITTMNSAFSDANEFNQDIGGWDTSKVTNMNYMFSGANSFNQNLSEWDTSKVTNMQYLFNEAHSFDGNITTWNTSSVTNMQYLFNNSQSFTGNISSWDTGNVTTMEGMFRNATQFDHDLGGWNVSSVTTMEGMFEYVNLSTQNYDSLLIGWANLSPELQYSVIFHAGDSQYCEGQTARNNILIGTHGWSITDGGRSPGCTRPWVEINSTDGTNRSNQDLNCVGTIFVIDPLNEYLNVTVDWYLFDELNLTQEFLNDYTNATLFNATLLSTNTSRDDVWWCSLTVDDGENQVQENSTKLTVLNTPPIVQNTTILPVYPEETDDLIGYCTATDTDLDDVDYEFIWYKDGVQNSSGSYTTQEQWADLNISSNYSDAGIQNPENAIDGDWDTYANSVLINAGFIYFNNTNIPSHVEALVELKYASTNDNTNTSVFACYNGNSWTPLWSWTGNEAGTINVTLPTSCLDNGDGVLQYRVALRGTNSFDPIQHGRFYEQRTWWITSKGFEQGVEQNVGNVSNTLTTKGDQWILSCRGRDLDGWGEWYNSSITSINALPNTPVVSINSTDGTNQSNQDLNCFATISDPDNDDLNVTVSWYKDGEFNQSIEYNDSYESGSEFSAALLHTNTSRDDDWSCVIELFDGAIYSGEGLSVNLTVLNTPPPTPTPIYPITPSLINRFPHFNWTDVNDYDGDVVTYEFNLTAPADLLCSGFDDDNLATSNVTSQIELCTLEDYSSGEFSWQVRAHDGTEHGEWSEWTSFNVTGVNNITLVNDTVAFGLVDRGESTNTTGDDPYPIVVRNDGNVRVNITVAATNALFTLHPTLNDESFQLMSGVLAGKPGSFNQTNSLTTWQNITLSHQLVINRLLYFDSSDEARIDLRINPPLSEPAGAKQATLNVTSIVDSPS